MRRAALALGLLAVTAYATDVRADDKKVCGDAYAASQSLRDEHRLLAARDQLRLCARQACAPFAGGQIVKDCASWLAQVEPIIPSLVFEARDGNGNDLSAVKVTMDGKPLAARLDGTGLQVDPGEHRFAFDSADAHADKTIVVREGDKDRHVSVLLGASSAVPLGATPSPSPAAPAAASSDGSTQRTIGLVIGGAGVVGLVLGGVFGVLAKSAYDGAGCPACTGPTVPQAAYDRATVSTIAFLAGGVLTVGGAVLYFTAPKAGSVGVAPSVGTSAAGLNVTGAW